MVFCIREHQEVIRLPHESAMCMQGYARRVRLLVCLKIMDQSSLYLRHFV